MKRLAVIVLAAGLGTRMKSSLAKVLHPLAGQPMISHTIDNVLALTPEKLVVVVGHQADKVSALLPDGAIAAVQEGQLGTAHAAQAGLAHLDGFDGMLLLVAGDTPLLGPDTFRTILDTHEAEGASVSILTAKMPDPTGYGRIIRDSGGVARIVEQKDATPDERAIDEINCGTYCFSVDTLRAALSEVTTENAQKEFYLTDVAQIVRAKGGKVLGIVTERPEESLGINSRVELSQAEAVLRNRINTRLMVAGVTIIDPATTYIGAHVAVGRDSIIYPGNTISGRTTIGEGCTLFPGNIIENTTIADNVTIKGYCVMKDSVVETDAQVGPFAHVRPGSLICADARVGNFVELKKTRLGKGSKASHLSYLGDSTIGEGVNIGAGTITCNYDGKNKHHTVIEDGVFVGSDTQIVAPVTIGKGAVIGAGTTVTKNVPGDALALSRVPQKVIEGWAKRKAQEPTKEQVEAACKNRKVSPVF